MDSECFSLCLVLYSCAHGAWTSPALDKDKAKPPRPKPPLGLPILLPSEAQVRERIPRRPWDSPQVPWGQSRKPPQTAERTPEWSAFWEANLSY